MSSRVGSGVCPCLGDTGVVVTGSEWVRLRSPSDDGDETAAAEEKDSGRGGEGLDDYGGGLAVTGDAAAWGWVKGQRQGATAAKTSFYVDGPRR